MRPTTFTPILLILTAVHKKITLNQLPQGCFLTHRLYFLQGLARQRHMDASV